MKTEVIKINPRSINKDKIKYAAKVLKNGGIVGFPTETVYGLGVNLDNAFAVKRLHQIKKRADGKISGIPNTLSCLPSRAGRFTAHLDTGGCSLPIIIVEMLRGLNFMLIQM